MNFTELAEQFLQNSYQLRNRGHQKIIDAKMQGEAFALLYLFHQGDTVVPSEISSEMNISSARVAAILNNLENKGQITRQIDKTDRRKILVTLTEAGANLAQKHSETVTAITARMLELLGENDAKELVRIMGKLAQLAPLLSFQEECSR